MTGPSSNALEECQSRGRRVTRDLALELGGPRALRAVLPTASLERDVGLGSLDRVELLLRLESAFDRELGDRFLLMDSVAEIAQSLVRSDGAKPLRLPERAAAAPAASAIGSDAATVHEALWRRAREEPDRIHVHLHH